MSQKNLLKHYARIINRWPTDHLRPKQPFQDVLRHRGEAEPANASHALKEINAAYLLLDDHFAKAFPLSAKTMKPTSSPDYYDTLKREMDEAPNRSMLGNFVKRMKTMFRWK